MPDDVLEKNHAASTAGFVIGECSVLVIESMLNGDLASQFIGLVRRVTTKPIRFLVNTSYHGDHAYGNFLFPDSTVVIQHPATKRYMEEYFEGDRRFMIGLMGKGKGIETRDSDRLWGRTRAGVGSGNALHDREHAGRRGCSRRSEAEFPDQV